MPAIARADGIDTVFSFTGVGKGCARPLNTVTGSSTITTIFVGGSPIVVQGDLVGSHPAGGCGPDLSTLSTYSGTVFAGGKGVGRIGDQYSSDNLITSGFSTVFLG
jgi:uncharacterized Zn-binding protein involved in type VI secretion